MSTSDDEQAFLEDASGVSDAEVCFLPTETDGAIALLSAIRDPDSWVSSDRPDFYSETYELAMEVMRVDDQPQIGKRTNPTLAREREAERKVRAALPALHSKTRVTVIADTELPSLQDHNFGAYQQTFARVLQDHARKVATYRANHPGYGLAMLIRDESSIYAQAEQSRNPLVKGEMIAAQPHFWFLDADFVRIIAASNADFVIWSTPYKHGWHIDALGHHAKLDLPALAIYDVAAMPGWEELLAYDPSRMLSLEE